MIGNGKRSTSWRAVAGTAVLFVGGIGPVNAGVNASAVLTFAQSGSNVLATVTGNVLTSALTSFSTSTASNNGTVFSNNAYIGATGSTKNLFLGLTYDTTSTPMSSFATAFSTPTSASGDAFGLQLGPGWLLHLPTAYTSGSNLSGTATFSGQTLSSMTLGVGTYRWTYGTSNEHEVKIVVSAGGTTGGGTTGGGGAVPEPGEWAAMGVLGAGLTGLVLRKRRKA
jgi:hypothetical protein